MDYHYKSMSGDDAAHIVDPFYKQHGWHTSYASDSDQFALAYHGETLVGCLRRCHENGIHMLRTMMVDPRHRGHGLGHGLLQFYEQNLLKNIDADIHCAPYAHLPEFYARIGFTVRDIDTAPAFIIKRIKEYTQRGNPTIYMVRPRKT